ncbi:uncharacterized protein LOC129757580 [Uranotaenia lowii]|uniref:uncharacterized protein LOC129757580 n=1 Tax=Uranotaenia lowii TaxID=190385 RepID=UPI0024785930|nr:uncharacterized protein LOC129757580 [Uranotaenia lowii]
MPPPLKQRDPTTTTSDSLRQQKAEEEADEPQDVAFPEFDKSPACIHVLLLNKTIRLFVILGLAAVVLPAFAYLFFFSQEIGHAEKRQLVGTCGHPTLYHIQCGYANISLEECHYLGCCFTTRGVCYHTLPSEYQYRAEDPGVCGNGAVLNPVRDNTPFCRGGEGGQNQCVPSARNVRISVQIIDQSMVQISLSTNNTGESAVKSTCETLETNDLLVDIYNETFFVEVKRKSPDASIILSTARGPLIVTEDGFLEWTLHLGMDVLYGLGEAVLEAGRKYLLLNNQNSSAVPVVMGYGINTTFFNGIVFSTPGLTEVEITGARQVLIRAQYTGDFKIQVLAGPSPQDIHRQLKQITANQYLPPYWAYGVHVCDERRNVSLPDVHQDIEDLLTEGMLFDSHCVNDDEFWLSSQMALSNNLTNILNMLRGDGKRFLASLVTLLEPKADPAYLKAKYLGLFLRNGTDITTYRGLVRNRTAVYLDWINPLLDGWFDEIWPKVENLKSDGYNLREASLRDDGIHSYPNQSHLIFLPESLNVSLRDLIRWDTKLSNSMERVLKSQNQQGTEMLHKVQRKMTPDQLLISGAYNMTTKAAIMSQNVTASWISLRREVNRAIGLSVSGINFIGSPICGNAGDNITEELCIRWYQFGSLLPLFKVSANRTPNRFSKFAARIMASTIRHRYALLEYYNTLLINEQPYLKPMFFNYFQEAKDFSVELWEQFTIGDALLVAPVLLPRMEQIDIYFPELYYELWSGEQLPDNKVLHYSVVEADLPIFIRPGWIVGLRNVSDEDVLVEQTRFRPFHLIGALKCAGSSRICSANGTLTLVKGFDITFTAVFDETLAVTVELIADDASRIVVCPPEADPNSVKISAEITNYLFYNNRTTPLAGTLPDCDLCQKTVCNN